MTRIDRSNVKIEKSILKNHGKIIPTKTRGSEGGKIGHSR
jgi:hypothetical protein